MLGYRGRGLVDDSRPRKRARNARGGAVMRVTVVVPLLGADVASKARAGHWFQGFAEASAWDCEWDLVLVEDGWREERRGILTQVDRRPDGIRVVQAARPGRGRALKDVWMASGSDAVASVDPGLRTNAARLRALLRPLREGEADLVVGARVSVAASGFRDWLLQGRGWVAEALTRWVTGSRLHDHRSGVVALTSTAVRGLVPHVRSTRDLFEMELLLLAQRLGWRILELPLVPLTFSSVRPGWIREFARLLRDPGLQRSRRMRSGAP